MQEICPSQSKKSKPDKTTSTTENTKVNIQTVNFQSKPVTSPNKLKTKTNYEKQLCLRVKAINAYLILQAWQSTILKIANKQGILEAYKQINQGNKNISECILEMQSGYDDIQANLTKKQATKQQIQPMKD